MGMMELSVFAGSLQMWDALPKDAAQAWATWQAACANIDSNPTDDLRTAAERGDFGPENIAEAMDKAAFRIAAKEKLTVVRQDLDYPLSRRFNNAVGASLDSIVATLGKHFDKAAQKLTTAAAAVPAHFDAEAVLTMSPAAADAWRDLATAGGICEEIARVRRALSRNYEGLSGHEVALFLGKPPSRPGEFARVQQVYLDPAANGVRGGRWRLMIDAGLTLKLNTRAEADAIIAAANDAEDAGRVEARRRARVA